MIVTVALLSKALPFGDAISELTSRILDTIERVSSNDEQLMTVRRRIKRIQVDLEPVLLQTCRPGRAFQHLIDVVSSLQQHTVKWARKSYMKKTFSSSRYQEHFQNDMKDLDRCIQDLTLLVTAETRQA
eukprot:544528-Hanusia_phi.AAC.2